MKLLMLFTTLLLVSCSKETHEVTDEFILPKGLEDCTVYSMHGEGGGGMMVIRCPNVQTTSTTHNCGKNCTRRVNLIK